jgi:hypothetical protein
MSLQFSTRELQSPQEDLPILSISVDILIQLLAESSEYFPVVCHLGGAFVDKLLFYVLDILFPYAQQLPLPLNLLLLDPISRPKLLHALLGKPCDLIFYLLSDIHNLLPQYIDPALSFVQLQNFDQVFGLVGFFQNPSAQLCEPFGGLQVWQQLHSVE